MPRLVFWNTTLPAGRGNNADEKRNVLRDFVIQWQPDLLFLTEMSRSFDEQNPMNLLLDNIVRTALPTGGLGDRRARYTLLTKTGANEGQHLLRAIFAKPGFQHAEAGLRELRGWGDGQRRSLLHVAVRGRRTIGRIFLLHANASPRGGRDAVSTLLGHLRANATDLAGGDFNYHSETDPNDLLTPANLFNNRAVFAAPRAGVHCPLPVPPMGQAYTQYNKRNGLVNLPGTFINFNPGGRLDFLLAGHAHTGNIAAVDGIPARPGPNSVTTWERQLIKHYDHLPVMYDWNPRGL